MKMTFSDIVLLFQWGCMIISSIVSIRLIKNVHVPKYMDKFYLYSLAAGVFAFFNFLQKYFSILSKSFSGFINSSLLLFHFIFLSIFIYKLLPKQNSSKKIIFLFLLFLSIILFSLFTNELSEPQSTAYAFANFGLVIFCCIYYLKLFEEMPIDLINEPSFWIINGIFFCMCATVPMNALRGYLLDNIPYDFFLAMGAIVSFAYGIMHLFFIKAYICSINRPKA